jgi:hypothetical protein
MTDQAEPWHGLPGAELIRQGLVDDVSGRDTVEAALVRIARGRLQALGVPVGSSRQSAVDDELVLYRLLQHREVDAHRAYNALLRELVSFERALEHRVWSARRAAGVAAL